jgi:GNAT superfamily N-acetyltransferase
VAGYRFCRTDDLPLLVAAYNACWLPHFGAVRALDLDDFKRDVRELNLWASSCMVAMEGDEPIGVLLGAKRDDGNLVYRLAVRPGHQRQGHGRHLLDSLRRKVAILGPPRLLVEVPGTWTEARAFVQHCGFSVATRYTDFVMDTAPDSAGPPDALVCEATWEELLDTAIEIAGNPPRSWERSLQTLKNRRGQLNGLAVASDTQVEAYLLYRWSAEGAEIVALGGAHPELLHLPIAALYDRSGGPLRIPKLSDDEVSPALLAALGFRATGEHIAYAADFSDL